MKKFYLILSVLAIALLLSACGSNQPAPTAAPAATEVPTDTVMEEAIKDSAEAVSETVNDAQKTVEEAVSDVADTKAEAEKAVEEAVSDAVASVSETYDEAEKAVSESVEAAVTSVSETYAEAEQAVKDAVADGSDAETIAETYKEAEKAVEEAVADAVQSVSDTYDEAEKAVAESVEDAAAAVDDTYKEAASVVEDAKADASEAVQDAVAEVGSAVQEGYENVLANSPYPDWREYDAFIKEIKSTTDFAERVEMMHEAEDMLMETGALLPIYYYNDLYMQSSKVDGIYSSVFGTKYFMYATKEGDNTLKINLASEPDHLDPALNSSVDGACLAANTFAGLYMYNDKGELVPQLAEGYEVSEDGLTYTFTLKDGLKWSDGSDLTAEDFVYSWKRASDPMTAADYSYMFDVIAGWDKVQEGEDALQVKATDAKTLVVTLNSPCAYMLDLMAFPTYFPVKQSAVEGAEDWVTNPGSWAQEAGFVSNGAYTLESWNHDESMVYVKNPYFYDADKVSIERIEFMLSADDTAIYAAYRAGDLDFADSVPTDEIASLKEDPEFHVIDNLGTYYVIFNVKSPLFDGKTVDQANAMRRAFGLLIDRQYIVDTVGQTGQQVATSFLPAGMADGNGGIFKDADAWNYPVGDGYYETEVDVDGARELLEYAGYEFGEDGKLSANTPISFEYLTNTASGHQAIAECIQQDLAEVGIEMTIRSIDWNVFLNERKEGNFDIARNGWLADFNDPINMLEMWTTNSGNNDAQFGRY
jgi:peptide/nickel transport system substrate-binding protein/oligopeptide transport system substrate-binding protein